MDDDANRFLFGFGNGHWSAFNIFPEERHASRGVGFSSGIMVAISLLELLATALTITDEFTIIFALALGFVFILTIDINYHMYT